MYIQK